MLNVIDEFTHECLAIRVARKLKAIDVIDVLSDLFILRGVPGHIRSDNTSITSTAFNRRDTRIAMHSCVNSSMTLSIRYFLPSCVRSSTKSYDHT